METSKPPIRSRGLAFLFGVLLLLALLGSGCGGDDDGGGDVAVSGLKEDLPAADELGMESERELEWDNSTDFVVEGLFISEGTAPSEVISAMDDAGFEGAAGGRLFNSDDDHHARISVAEFESEDGAVEAREVLHEEDLKQPCFAACTVSPEEYEVDGIPSSQAVHQVPNEGKPPAGVFKFEAYHAEFVIGPRLYVIQMDSSPGKALGAAFDRSVKTFYEGVSSSEPAA